MNVMNELSVIVNEYTLKFARWTNLFPELSCEGGVIGDWVNNELMHLLV